MKDKIYIPLRKDLKLGKKIKDKYLNNYLDNFERKIAQKVIKVASEASPQKWTKIIDLADKLDITDEYKPVINGLRRIFSEGHPSLQFIKILKQKAPACRDKFLINFFIRATLKGLSKRRRFTQKHRADYQPFFFVISPTMRCNLYCLGCYAGQYTNSNDLPFDVLDKIFSEAQKMGMYFITISGGEPFLRDDLLQLYQKHNKVYFQVYTNGTLINKNLAKQIAQLGNIAPVISIEGLKKETDQRRGKGTFKKICQAFDNLREAGVIFGFSAMPIKYNFDCLSRDDFYQFLMKKGCLFGWFFQYIPIGRNVDLDLMLTAEERLSLYEKVKAVRNQYPIFIADFWNDGKYTQGCIAAARDSQGYFHINSKGDIEPCVFVHFAQDNIIEIYKRGGHLWDGLDSKFFKAIRGGQPWNKDHRMPCMIVDNPLCLREIIQQTKAQPTHVGAESIVEDPKIIQHLDTYSQTLCQLCGRNKKMN